MDYVVYERDVGIIGILSSVAECGVGTGTIGAATGERDGAKRSSGDLGGFVRIGQRAVFGFV